MNRGVWNEEYENMNDLNLKEIISIIKKRIFLIFFAPILFAAMGAIVSIYFIEPVYESSTTLIINQNKAQGEMISKADVDLSKSLIYTYAEIAKSNIVLEKTKQELNMDNLDSNSITVFPLKDTQILKVSVRNTDPKLSKDKLPSSPIKPNKLMNTAVAGILGEIIILLSVFLVEYFDNTIKTEKDIEKYLEIPVVGSVPNFNQGSKKAYEKYRVRRKTDDSCSGVLQKDWSKY